MLLSETFEYFITDKMTYAAPDTVRYYRDSVSGFLSWLNKNDVIDSMQLSQDLLKQYLVFLRDVRQIKHTSIHTYFRGIRNFCLFCIEQQYCDYFNYKIRLPRPDPALVLPLTSSEVDIIFKYIDESTLDRSKSLLLIRLMLDMGLRRSEVINLQLNHIDFINKVLRVVNSKYNKSRLLPIPDCVMNLIKDHCNCTCCTFIFDISSEAIESFFARLKLRTGIQRLHPHLLRHTFASSYMLQHSNLEYLRLYMGHSSYTVTQRYIHISMELMLCNYDCYKIDPIFK